VKDEQGGLFSYEELVCAVDLPTGVCKALTQAVLSLRKVTNPLHQQVFWIPANVAHVGVLNTGRVRTDLQDLVADAMRGAVSGFGAFKLRLKGLKLRRGAGDGEEAPVEAIWVGVEPTEQLVELRGKLQQALAELDVDADTSAYEPHVPLALMDQFRSTREFGSAFVEWQDKDFGEVPVHSLLLKSVTPKKGTSQRPFSVLANLPFKAREEEGQ